MKNKNSDSILELKECSVLLSFLLMTLKEKIVSLLLFNEWILSDMNLFENYTKLKEMIDISQDNLKVFVSTMKKIDNYGMPFSIVDIADELMYISDNIELETRYLENMLYYIDAYLDFTLDINDIIQINDEYVENDRIYYNQMKINNEGLKKLRKERRDYLG